MIEDYKPRKEISQDSVNNNEWTFWQTYGLAIGILSYAIFLTAINLIG